MSRVETFILGMEDSMVQVLRVPETKNSEGPFLFWVIRYGCFVLE
jgi:hypothetical protein